MKKVIIFLLLLPFLLFPSVSMANDIDYNHSCPFISIERTKDDYNFQLKSIGNYRDKLVEGTQAMALLEIRVYGNISGLNEDIQAYIRVSCNHEPVYVEGTNTNMIVSSLDNGTQVTRLSFISNFYIHTELKGVCRGYAQIYGTNNTWEESLREKGCINCACFIEGLSAYGVNFRSEEFPIHGLSDFYAFETNEQNQIITTIGIISGFVGVILGAIITFVFSLRLHRIEFKKKILNELLFSISKCEFLFNGFVTNKKNITEEPSS